MRVNALYARGVATSVLASHETDPHADGIVTPRKGERP